MLGRLNIPSTVNTVEDPLTNQHTAIQVKQHYACFFVLINNQTTHLLNDDNQTIFFHGNAFFFNKPNKVKHQTEYSANVKFACNILNKIGIPFLVSEQYPLLRYHRDVVFIPILTSSAYPLYIYPWTSTPKDSLKKIDCFPKIKEFTLASCLFGGSILGIDEQENSYPLIDHNLQVVDMIIKIEVSETIHPYEAQTFAVLEKLFLLMLQINKNNAFIVRYHLPIIDYMLYGIHLYISGKIAFIALNEFIEQVKNRGEKHKKIITALAQQAGINIQIESPFDNLFPTITSLSADSLLNQLYLSRDQMERMKIEHPHLAKHLRRAALRGGYAVENFKFIIEVLNAWDEAELNTAQSFSHQNSQQEHHQMPRELFEELCIENILTKLASNTRLPEYKQVWKKIIEGGQVTRFTPLQQLFKVANISLLARACIERTSLEVCSLLPIDEKPIALAYKDFLANQFGHILCLSWFPPLLSYINTNGNHNSQEKNHENNLFRFRPDLFSFSPELMKIALTNRFELTKNFWDIVNNNFGFHQENSQKSNFSNNFIMFTTATNETAKTPYSATTKTLKG